MDNYQKEKKGKRGNLVKTWGREGLPNPTSMFLLFLQVILLQNYQKTGKLGENSHTGGVHPRGKNSPVFSF